MGSDVTFTLICISINYKWRGKRRENVELEECGSEREEQRERRGGEIREKKLMDFLSELIRRRAAV